MAVKKINKLHTYLVIFLVSQIVYSRLIFGAGKLLFIKLEQHATFDFLLLLLFFDFQAITLTYRIIFALYFIQVFAQKVCLYIVTHGL